MPDTPQPRRRSKLFRI
ncbi:hypothetical protein ACFPZP_14200 [Citrobacter bitternis]|uniref:Uncharacterized protein n=1 Tax=Citrobacter bitternis TaxID=1585982 RepID=A0ABW1PZX9_9ENTR